MLSHKASDLPRAQVGMNSNALQMSEPHMSLNDTFNPESFETIEESPFAFITRAQFIPDDSHREGHVVALKSASTLPEFSQEPHDIVKELRLLSSLSHPNVIEILGQSYDSKPCTLHFWMPLIPVNLRDLLDCALFSPFSYHQGPEHHSQQRTLFIILAKSIAFQVISALAYLHDASRKIAHRDIKPRNILLDHHACVKVIDFGVSWSADVLDCMWPEPRGSLYFDVCTGPYRAPELLFGARDYDPFAVDLWSLGATLAEFFTSLRLIDRWGDDSDSDNETDPESATPQPFIIPTNLKSHIRLPNDHWSRDSLFDASRGSIGLAWSIFKIRGTPNSQNWPTFDSLPDASKVSFQDVPPLSLAGFLPNLPPAEEDIPFDGSHFPKSEMTNSPLDLVHRLLVYPPERRLRSADALNHPWFTSEPHLLLPDDYPLQDTRRGTTDGKRLKDALEFMLRTYSDTERDTWRDG